MNTNIGPREEEDEDEYDLLDALDEDDDLENVNEDDFDFPDEEEEDDDESSDGIYWALMIRFEGSAYFLTDHEGRRLDSMLQLRDEQTLDDRADSVNFTDLAGEPVRCFIQDISGLRRSTPDSRIINAEITRELKARVVAEDVCS